MPALYNSPSEVECYTPEFLEISRVPIQVSNNGRDYISIRDISFEYTAALVVHSIAPPSGPESGGTIITISGEHFTETTSCRFGNTKMPAIFLSDSRITCATPPSMDGANPLVDIAVTSNKIDFFLSDIDFEYRSSASVYAVYPASGSTSGSTRVTVTGSNFQEGPGLYCRFGSVAVSASEVLSSEQLVCVSPPMSSGTVDVEITNDERARDANGTSWTKAQVAGGMFSHAQWTMDRVKFVYATGPDIMEVHPFAGSQAGGTTMRIMGSNFRNVPTFACEVSLMSADHLDMLVPGHFVSPSVMQCIAPAVVPPIDAITIASIRITNNGQDFTPHGAQFEYRPVPVVTSLHPYRGLEAGGNVVTVSGRELR